MTNTNKQSNGDSSHRDETIILRIWDGTVVDSAENNTIQLLLALKC